MDLAAAGFGIYQFGIAPRVNSNAEQAQSASTPPPAAESGSEATDDALPETLPDFTLAIPYAMPSLFALATLGCLGAVVGFPSARTPILTLWLAALPMTLALFAAIATAQRYTGDFCPLLICAACFGLAVTESLATPWLVGIRLLITIATLCAMAVTTALTLHYQGETLWGVPESTRRNYQELRRSIDAFFGTTPAIPPQTQS